MIKITLRKSHKITLILFGLSILGHQIYLNNSLVKELKELQKRHTGLIDSYFELEEDNVKQFDEILKLEKCCSDSLN